MSWEAGFITLRLTQNGCHFANDILKFIILFQNCCIFFFQISRRFVSKGRIDNKPALYIWSNDKLVYWGIYAWLGLDELYRREDSMIYYEWCLEEITCFREKATSLDSIGTSKIMHMARILTCFVVVLQLPNLPTSHEITDNTVNPLSRTLVGNKLVDHSDVVGASPVGAAPTTSSSST